MSTTSLLPARQLGVVCIAVGMVAMVACSDRTGVLLEVTRDENSTPAAIDQLRFFVGTQIDVDSALAGEFVNDEDPAELVMLAAGRDLLVDPYRLLINRGAADEVELMLAVAAYKGEEMVGFGGLSESIGFISGSVMEWELVVKGGWAGRVDVTATGCLLWTTDNGTVVISASDDLDCDDDRSDVDCDDSNPDVGPSQPEICDNGINDDCDSETDEEEDADEDGVFNCSGDCDDQDDRRFPGNPEICDGVDNDCNEICDDGPLDYDNDHYTICDRKILADGSCSDLNESYFDCNDADPEIHPGAPEICDGIDNNCNGVCEEGFDPDHDNYTVCGSKVNVCLGTNDKDIDCEPEEETAFPGNTPEICDGLDNDCDGAYYRGVVPCYGLDEYEELCVIGSRTCGDADGEGWTSECESIGEGAVVPAQLCVAYELCEDADAPDPYACANDEVASTTYHCTLDFPQANPSALCEPASARLPNTATADEFCLWAVLPATSREPLYDVGFSAEANAAGNDVIADMCGPFFVVNDSYPAPPQVDSFMVYQEVDYDGAQVFKVEVVPNPVVQCSDGGGLHCAGFPDPG